MNVAVVGASGFLGKRLCRRLLDDTEWNVRAVARNESKLNDIAFASERFEITRGDVLDYDSIFTALNTIDVAYYFVHLMGHKERDFYEAELDAARIFVEAANATGVRRVIYVGGLGDTADSQSKHLRSRHDTGEILRNGIETIELSASMIIGKGSVAFDIIENVARHFPLMVMPAEANTKTQPIAADDALDYLVASATVDVSESVQVDIGGPIVMSYADIYRAYAKHIGKAPIVIRLPFVPASFAGLFLNLVTPKIHARIGQVMFESMNSEMVVCNNQATILFPTILPQPIESAFDK